MKEKMMWRRRGGGKVEIWWRRVAVTEPIIRENKAARGCHWTRRRSSQETLKEVLPVVVSSHRLHTSKYFHFIWFWPGSWDTRHPPLPLGGSCPMNQRYSFYFYKNQQWIFIFRPESLMEHRFTLRKRRKLQTLWGRYFKEYLIVLNNIFYF